VEVEVTVVDGELVLETIAVVEELELVATTEEDDAEVEEETEEDDVDTIELELEVVEVDAPLIGETEVKKFSARVGK
jgi:hypothetical protein